jgi:hypothetical protein
MMADVRLRTGLLTATNYAEAAAMGAIAELWRPYILPVGAFVGGAAGFVLLNTTRGVEVLKPFQV